MNHWKSILVSVTALTAAFMASGQRTATPYTSTPFLLKNAPSQTLDKRGAHPLQQSPRRARALDVPFHEDFSSPSTLNDWGIQDVNNDGSSWEYKESAQLVACYFATRGGANNDWLITPAINLGKDDIYTLTFSFGSQGERFTPEALTVTMGTSEYATQHTTVLFSRSDIVNFWNGSMETVTITLPVEADGAYYFGFHCTTPAGGYCLYLDDVSVEQNGSYGAPAAVEDLTVTPGANGAQSATITLTAPTRTSAGQNLSGAQTVKLYRDDDLIKTFDGVAAGASLSHTDSGMSHGLHTYKAIANSGGEDGAKAEVTAYIGIDTPLPATAFRGREQGNDVVLTWEQPAGANGGYVGGDAVSYSLVRIDQEGETLLGSSISGLTYTDRGVGAAAQTHVYYTLKASTVVGESDEAVSNSLFIGPAYPLPFTENFEYCELATSPWVMEYIDSGWYPSTWRTTAMGSYPVCPPIDGDDGMLEFLSKIDGFNLYAGNVIRLATPAIDLSTATNPFVEFYLFHYDTTVISQEYDSEAEEYVSVTNRYSDKLNLQVALDNGEYVDVPEAEIMLAKNNNGWTLYRIPLDAYKGHSKVSVALVGTSDGGGNICVDHFKVTDTYTDDLAFTGLMGPEMVKVGETATYTANIVNNGASSTKDYTVHLFVDGEKVSSAKGQGAAIFANGGVKTLKLEFTPTFSFSGNDHTLYAEIEYANDECPVNNRSRTIPLTVPAQNDLPKVDTLNGSREQNNVVLTWEEPDMSNVRGTVCDNMENYEAFSISNIGNYTLIDNDRASATYTVSGIQNYPNAGAPMAWQVFDARQAGIDTELDFNRRWTAHSGKQSLVAWGADSSTSGVYRNDDWIISPEISPDNREITFYIKSVTLAYPERFRVLYSAKSMNLNDFYFVSDVDYYTPTSYWRKFTTTLPEGAKYFAIQCISADAFGLMLDDVIFSPKSAALLVPDFVGYNVYRDGEKITSAPQQQASFTDVLSDTDEHTYFVTVQYTDGESAPSSTFCTKDTGIENLFANGNFTAVGHTGCLEVDGCNGLVEVFAPNGTRVAARRVVGNLTFGIAPGLYIVVHNNHRVKTMVK